MEDTRITTKSVHIFNHCHFRLLLGAALRFRFQLNEKDLHSDRCSKFRYECGGYSLDMARLTRETDSVVIGKLK